LRWALVAVLSACLLICTGARAQNSSDSDFANCKELSDPDAAFKLELCSSHAACKMVAKVYKTCTAVRSFVERVANSVGQGVKTFFGYRKEVSPDNLWEALQTDNSTRRLDDIPAEKYRGTAIKQALATTDLRATEGRDANGSFISYGSSKDGGLQGWGMKVSDDGAVTRGQFRDGKLEGQGEWLAVNANGLGARMSGEFSSNRLQGEGAMASSSGLLAQGRFQAQVLTDGKLTAPDGTRQEGRFDPKNWQLIDGSKYAADGSPSEKGTFRDGQLYVGERYAAGQVVAIVNRPRELMQQAEARQSANAERARALDAEKAAAEQRVRDEAALREQKFKTDLAGMNVGQLFALADELQAAGRTDPARQAMRALVTRFPDHPLATQAAANLSGASAKAPSPIAPAAPDRTTSPGTAQASARQGPSQKSCDAERVNAESAYRQARPGGNPQSMNASLAGAAISVPIGDEAAARRLYQQELQRRAGLADPFQRARSEYLGCILESAYGDLSGPAAAVVARSPDNPGNNSITGTAAAFAGASSGDVCKGETLNNPYYESSIKNLQAGNSPSISLRGAMVGLELMLISLRRCPPSERVRSQIAHFEQQRDQALSTCRQIVSHDNCMLSPF
jgi:hypothetical protein